MSFLVVPHGVTDTTATVWVGAVDEPRMRERSVTLEYGDGSVELEPNEWLEWRSYEPGDVARFPLQDRLLRRVLPKSPPILRTLYYRRVRLGGLKPRRRYPLRLLVDGRESVMGMEKHLRRGRVETLPEELPRGNGRPFTLLLGSCFYGPEDRQGMVGAAYRCIPEERRPDVKVLCGDQVYLDNPWRETTFRWYGGNRRVGLFRDMLFQKYVNNWSQVRGEDAGFRHLLADGSNYFCSDDHEFWNNAPNFGGVGLVNTLTAEQRLWWMVEARRLFRAFQSPEALLSIEVPPLSVRIADTRIYRDPAGERFMRDRDLRAIGDWIRNLEGPGVLVLGQPLLAEGGGLGASLRKKGLVRTVHGSFDRDLPDYAAYGELVGYIRSSPSPIVVLSGDVHFGRVARGGSGPRGGLIEVISSPTQAVLDAAGNPLFGRYRPAPTDRFPGLRSGRVAPYRNHFATVEFSRNAKERVAMTVRSWPIPYPGDAAPEGPETVFQAELA